MKKNRAIDIKVNRATKHKRLPRRIIHRPDVFIQPNPEADKVHGVHVVIEPNPDAGPAVKVHPVIVPDPNAGHVVEVTVAPDPLNVLMRAWAKRHDFDFENDNGVCRLTGPGFAYVAWPLDCLVEFRKAFEASSGDIGIASAATEQFAQAKGYL